MVKEVMKNKIYEFGSVIVLLFVFSYLLNFLWESFHSVFLYAGHNFNAIRYVPMIGYVSAVDSLLILGIYLAISLLWKNFLWLKEMSREQIYTTIIIGLIIGAFIEYRAIFLQQRWSYNAIMPTIFGLGLSPLLQLSMTGIVALWLTKRLLYGKGILYGR